MDSSPVGGRGLNVDNDHIPPQFIESNKRLLFSTEYGIYSSPKLETDEAFGTSTIQLAMRKCGCPPAVPFFLIELEDTAATYNANWLE